MAESLTFKNYGRTTRNMIVEESYAGGMMYTDNALDTTNVKTVVNYNYKDDGLLMVPRSGLFAHTTIPLTQGVQKVPMLSFTGVNVTKENDVHLKDYRARGFLAGPLSEAVPMVAYPPGRKGVLFAVPQTELVLQKLDAQGYTTSLLVNKFDEESADVVEQTSLALVGTDFDKSTTVHGYSTQYAKTHVPVTATLGNKLYGVLCNTAADNTLFLGELSTHDKDNVLSHRFQKVKATALSPKEVINTGYNMLLDSPYTFTNTAGAVYEIDGILPYTTADRKEDRELLLSARQGQDVCFECFYKYKTESNVTLRARWEWIDPNSSAIEWTCIQTHKDNDTANPGAPVSQNYTPGDSITVNFQPTVQQFQLRLSLYKRTGETVADAPLKVMVMPLYKLATDTSSTVKNIKPVKYNIATASGMTVWKQRMVAWGVTGAENILFTSEVNNPGYFPYPNNIDIFDEDIKHVVEFQDGLLVFTSTKIYMATLLEDGIGFATTLVQNRLMITSTDVRSIQVIKSMVFFKSDNYYYMIVPKINSFKGELTLAPVSKPINNFFDDFDKSLREILEILYHKQYNSSEEYAITFLNYHNYVDGNAVRNVYIFDTTHTDTQTPELSWSVRIAVTLNYDTMLRTWTIHIHQCNDWMIPITQSVTDGTVLVDICYDGQANSAQLVAHNTSVPSDVFSLNLGAERVIKNYQYLDTGYRKQGEQHKKRFREIQMKFNNTSGHKLEFYSEFMIDDAQRQTYYRYNTQHITDPANPAYGLLYLEREVDPTFDIMGNTILADTTDISNSCWTLDNSKFPPRAVVKVRFPVSGKGYAPRLKLLSFNEKQFELLNINWVSRSMNSR